MMTWSPELEALGDALIAALERRGHTSVPTLEGDAQEGVLARWLYRRILDRRGCFIPWRTWTGTSSQTSPHEQEHGAVIDLSGAHTDELVESLVSAGQWVLTRDPRRVCLPEDTPRLLALDELHGVATDPSLEHVRRCLLAHSGCAGIIQLRGEPGVGKASLARWAHLNLDRAAMSWIAGEHAALTAGRWALFEEVTELGAQARQALTRALLAHTKRPPRWSPAQAATGPRVRPLHHALDAIVGQSPALLMLLDKLVSVAPLTLPVLLYGEPGVGKEVMARALHDLSGRAGPLVALDMGAMTESLAESELFGHAKGAFSGAIASRQGAFRRAHSGTLFLDEIGNLTLPIQAKLLRALQEGLIRPVGSDEPSRVDVRIIAATNTDLERAAREGSFRLDLLSRLNAVTLKIPPLRERLEDLEALAESFANPPGETSPWCTPEVLEALRAHAWPGNVRELKHVIELAVALSAERPVGLDALGALSCMTPRPAPVITTHSGSPEELTQLGLERALAQQMTAVTIEVPPLRARGEDALRHTILTSLHSQAITEGALSLLQTQPWWGNLPELRACLNALRQLSSPLIGVEQLQTVLPKAFGRLDSAPIHVLLAASRVEDDLEGLHRQIDAGALLIGRIPRLDALTAASQGGDERAQRWLVQLRELLGEARPACLDLEFLRRLSRAHVLVVREARGLVLHHLEGAGLRVWASSWAAPHEREVSPRIPFELGMGGMICWGSPSRQGPYLRAFVYLGEATLEMFKPVAFSMIEQDDEAPSTLTRPPAIPRDASPGPTPREGGHVWALEAHEQEALTDLLMSYRGGSLKAHLSYGLAGYRGQPQYARLVSFFDDAPRPSQYLTRLYELEGNAALRSRLLQRLSLHGHADALMEAWPLGLRRLLMKQLSS